jgi:hypothetical protein
MSASAARDPLSACMIFRPRSKASSPRLDNEIPGFELDGVLAVIPEPRVWALLLAGYALIGFGLRRGRDRARRVTG